MIVYRTPTSDKHITIHKGTKTTSHDQLIKPSNRKAKKINCRTFTAQNNSN